MPKVGILVQMDSSLHRWIKDIPESWWLVAKANESDGFVYGKFFPFDTTTHCSPFVIMFLSPKVVEICYPA